MNNILKSKEVKKINRRKVSRLSAGILFIYSKQFTKEKRRNPL
jgi:hypothetical protein